MAIATSQLKHKYSVWTDDGPYFAFRGDTLESALQYIDTQGGFGSATAPGAGRHYIVEELYVVAP